MEERREQPAVRKVLDDLFDAYTILGKGNYVAVYDVKGQMTRYSPAAVELFGLAGEYVPVGAVKWSKIIHPEDRKRYERSMAKLLDGSARHYDISYRVRLKDGSYSRLRFVGSVLRDEDGHPDMIGGVMINEGLIEFTDSVTMLRNRYGFFRDVSTVLELKRKCVLLLIGLRGMGGINEMHGYTYGTHVLQQVSWMLQEMIGQDGALYRMDGAKFAFLTVQMEADEVAQRYEAIRRAMLSGIPVDNARQSVFIGGGLLSLPEAGADRRAVYDGLAFACKESRVRKDGKLVNFNGSGGRDLFDTLDMIRVIRNCIVMDCEGFSLRYQPVLANGTGRLIGLEALLRWKYGRFGEVMPSDYVPVLEKDFIFEELGYWILRRTMEEGKPLLERYPEYVMGVNIAQAQLADELFADSLTEIAEQVGFPLDHLCLELTKDCRLMGHDMLKSISLRLKSHGVRILLDDFGSGFGSIEVLRDLAPDYIKIGRSYAKGLEEDSRNRELARYMSELAATCGTRVCIKGIETRAAHEIVQTFPVRGLQGYFYGRPMPMKDLLELRFSLPE